MKKNIFSVDVDVDVEIRLGRFTSGLTGSLVVVVVQMTATAVNYNLLIAVELAIAKISTVNGNSTAHFATATTKIPADNCS